MKKEQKEPRYDERNKLNDLTGKEWLKKTKSYIFSNPTKIDKDAMNHPAPFIFNDIVNFIEMFTKEKQLVLDPFVGSGTTLLASNYLKRNSIGFDLNIEYKELYNERVKKADFKNLDFNSQYIIDDSLNCRKYLSNESVDFIITSPPYHNILKNKTKGLRKENNNYRNGARKGIQFYSESENDLGNFEEYEDFLLALNRIFKNCFYVLKSEKYFVVIISDFTINKVERCVQGDIVNLMSKIGFIFQGTKVILQETKALYPFGYPYKFKINHNHQNAIIFMKP